MNQSPLVDPDGLPDSYLTLAGTSEAEIKIQRSRFLGIAFPAASEDEARSRIEETGRRFHDARHVCYGYHLGLGPETVSRRNDDGEPSGTAGEPILKAIERSGVHDVLVVVMRWFGGVKLGTGGLARAYGQAADLALEAAPRREILLGRHFQVSFAYARKKTLRRLLDQHAGRITGQDYGADVTWRIWLPHSRWRDFSNSLTELTAGSVSLVVIEPVEG